MTRLRTVPRNSTLPRFLAFFATPALLAVLSSPLFAATPEKGHVAVSGVLGVVAPFESDYELGFHLEGAMDYYFERRISGRGTVGYYRGGADLPGDPSVGIGYLLASGVYNWELGSVHPYALAGAGLYAVNPAYGGSTARVGAHAGGGADFFLTRRTAIAAEGVFHFVGKVEGQKQSFFAFHAGVRYFF